MPRGIHDRVARSFAGKTSYAKNMETLPGQLMTAVMLVSMTADSNAERVAEAALSRMEFYEREGRGEFPLAH